MTVWSQWNQMNPGQQQQYMQQLLGLRQQQQGQGAAPLGNPQAGQAQGGGQDPAALNAAAIQQGMLANYQQMQPVIAGQGLYGALAPQQTGSTQPATSPYPMAGGYSGWGGGSSFG